VIFEDNARRVFPRLDPILTKRNRARAEAHS
jgi:hypothetical protein